MFFKNRHQTRIAIIYPSWTSAVVTFSTSQLTFHDMSRSIRTRTFHDGRNNWTERAKPIFHWPNHNRPKDHRQNIERKQMNGHCLPKAWLGERKTSSSENNAIRRDGQNGEGQSSLWIRVMIATCTIVVRFFTMRGNWIRVSFRPDLLVLCLIFQKTSTVVSIIELWLLLNFRTVPNSYG